MVVFTFKLIFINMRNDKKSHMKKANKAFQDRTNKEAGYVGETRVIYHMPDLYPGLTQKIKGL